MIFNDKFGDIMKLVRTLEECFDKKMLTKLLKWKEKNKETNF